MKPYRNQSGNSNVVAYEATEHAIQVVFKSGQYRNYLYNSDRPGSVAVEKLKQLADQGYGLNSYISSFVKSQYAKKW